MADLQKWTLRAGEVVVRYSVVLFFLLFGLAKFTAPEAASIHPLLVHSPFLFWLPAVLDQQAASDVIGIVEIAFGLLMASRPFTPCLAAIGSFGIAGSLVVTLSFLVTTPNLDPALGAFIVKDFTLLGAALWSAGEALAAIPPRPAARQLAAAGLEGSARASARALAAANGRWQ